MHDEPAYDGLGDEALARIATSLSDLYYTLYEERPLDPRASLTGNMLAFVFSDGLSVADRWLLKCGRDDRLREFRKHFFEVVSGELIALVSGLTGFRVNYSFYGFDPGTRTTHAIFVLDLERAGVDHEERRAVLNWSEQVRRNARRLGQEDREAPAKHTGLREEWQRKRDEMGDAQTDDAGVRQTPRGRCAGRGGRPSHVLGVSSRSWLAVTAMRRPGRRGSGSRRGSVRETPHLPGIGDEDAGNSTLP